MEKESLKNGMKVIDKIGNEGVVVITNVYPDVIEFKNNTWDIRDDYNDELRHYYGAGLDIVRIYDGDAIIFERID